MSRTPEPVFLLAAPYCGASFIAAALGTHPQILATPQLNLFFAERVEELLEVFRLSQEPVADGLLRTIAQLHFDGQGDAQIESAGSWLQAYQHLEVGALLSDIQQRAGDRFVLVPDTETPMRPADLARLHAQVPQARFIHLTRHPWTQGVLMCEALSERLFVPADFRDASYDPAPVEPQLPWLRANHNIERWVRDGREDRYLHVSVETFEHDADACLQRILLWLGLDASAQVLEQMRAYERWPFWGFGPRGAPFGLELEALEAFPEEALQTAYAQVSLQQTPPWQPGREGFDARVREFAHGYGYH